MNAPHRPLPIVGTGLLKHRQFPELEGADKGAELASQRSQNSAPNTLCRQEIDPIAQITKAATAR